MCRYCYISASSKISIATPSDAAETKRQGNINFAKISYFLNQSGEEPELSVDRL
jgi:hypothetical protein